MNDNNKTLYFAYGSNMDERQMAYRCPGAVLLGKTRLEAWRFALDSHKVATIIPDDAAFVEGLVWELSPDNVKVLDRYEGVSSNCYRKDMLSLTLDGRQVSALVYISSRPLGGKFKRSPYMYRIIAAAREHGFSPEYLAELERF